MPASCMLIPLSTGVFQFRSQQQQDNITEAIFTGDSATRWQKEVYMNLPYRHALDGEVLLLRRYLEAELLGSVTWLRTMFLYAGFKGWWNKRTALGCCLRLRHQAGIVFKWCHHVIAEQDSKAYLRSICRIQTNREKAVLRVLKVSPGTSTDLCAALYGSGTAAMMARELIEQHLEDLRAQGRAKSSEGFLGTIWWEAVTFLPLEA
ncbi:unnamed protein product [Symbiodinium natans]|uniref:Uncharacterized protein n=1 Tax=Symbiodinium natans TaxID=878477 RepID=A0A812RA36_9DINO|nr:unnamed protein product [Symbiodinium natans]